ncbi:integrase [Kribbella sandramycini]|uniref:Integrase n=1 Tax=Kribbella sandramycini TaxID=60450 RepID=A0A7Y4L0I8_9ACTN|nr:integrase [Kribbella sandramycini]MBB6565781.1 integrase [Kribbella sandramycini]NOL42044.1 integrase [Kribbella sandramycini]
METTFDVRIFKKFQIYERVNGKSTYRVRWTVAGETHGLSFTSITLAEGERSRLLSAVGRGEAFYIDTGRPISEARAAVSKVTFYGFACEYVDMKWPNAAANTRRSIADALITVTPALLKGRKTGEEAKAMRRALHKWAYNTAHRESAPEDVQEILKWVDRNSRPLADLAKKDTIRAALDAVGNKLDGKPASTTYAGRRRAVLWNLCEYAIERGYLSKNPITTVKRVSKPTRLSDVVDPATVPNPQQAEELLLAVAKQPGSGPRMAAFFGSMYYSALRPGEAADLTRPNLHIPEVGRGKLWLTGSNPFAGGAWTDTGEEHDKRQLKHRERGAGRWAPCPSKMTSLFHRHLEDFGVDAQGRLFWAERGGGPVPGKTYQEIWRAARIAVLGEETARTSNLARRPYDLRHAAVSTWLASGVEPKRVAEWAGQSLEVLMRIYAKCLDGLEEQALDRIESKLGA